MATTTKRYLSYPAAAAGVSRTSSGSTAWSFSAYTDLVPSSAITSDFYIAGLTWSWPTPAAAADVTYEYLIELAVGGAGSEVLIIQVPCSYRCDTLVGYVPSNFVVFAEPKLVAANSTVRVRFAYNVATTSKTIDGIKIMYQIT